MKLLRLAMPLIALFALVAPAASADTTPVRYLMTIENVNTVPINIQAFSWGMSNPTTLGPGGGLSAGRVSISSFNIMKQFDAASTILANACANGVQFPSARVRAYRGANTTPFMDIYFDTVMVESIQWSATTNAMPNESVSFAFAKVTLNGVLLSPELVSNPAAMNQLMASLMAAPAKPAAKKTSKISVR